jgi:transposase
MRGGYVIVWLVAIGVDTHKQWHVAVALDRLGRLVDALTVAAMMAGYRQLLVWARGLGEPVFAVEGCGSYGSGLAGFLGDHGETVFECERPRRGERRGGQRERLRLLLLERWGAARARTAALNQLDAVIVTAPDDLRRRLASVPKRRLVVTVARLRLRRDGMTSVLRRIARCIHTLTAEIDQIDRELGELVSRLAPDLLGECGVGVGPVRVSVYAGFLDCDPVWVVDGQGGDSGWPVGAGSVPSFGDVGDLEVDLDPGWLTPR